MTTAHTVTPLRICEYAAPIKHVDLYRNHPTDWTRTITIATVFNKADAEFIVRACNSHDALVEALVNLQKQVHAHRRLDVRRDFSLMVADAAATRALAKAKAGAA